LHKNRKQRKRLKREEQIQQRKYERRTLHGEEEERERP
jgi:hypothetical protein